MERSLRRIYTEAGKLLYCSKERAVMLDGERVLLCCGKNGC